MALVTDHLPLLVDESNEGLYCADFPFVGPLTEELCREDRIIVDRICRRRRSIRYRNTVFIFVPNRACWADIYTPEAQSYLSSLIESKASVNYSTAVAPFIKLICESSMQPNQFPRSLCINLFRLRPAIDGDTIRYTQVINVAYISSPNDVKDQLISSMCLCPVSTSRVPSVLPLYVWSAGEEMLSRVYSDRYVKLILNTIGRALLDPLSASKILIFYGIGGRGKTRAIETISGNTPEASKALSKDYMAMGKFHLTEKDLVTLLTNRMVTYGDGHLVDKYKLPCAFFKLIAGDDSITSTSVEGRISCTAFLGTNHMFTPDSDSLQTSISRRMELVLLKDKVDHSRPPIEVFNDVDIVHFVNSCTREALLNDTIPLDTEMALRSLLGSKYEKCTRAIYYCDFDDILLSRAATISVACFMNIDVDRLISLIKVKSHKLIINHNGLEALSGVSIVIPTIW